MIAPFDKRINFAFITARDHGVDAILANEWYCSLTVKERKAPNAELRARFLAWLPTNELEGGAK